jgi:hypothetical protein
MKRQLLIATSLMFAAGAVFAATQGTQGTTSQGDTTITLNNNQRVVVAGIGDITTDASGFDGVNPLDSGWMDFCIGQNTAFNVDVAFESTKAGAGNAYVVDDNGAPADTVGYTVTFSDDTGGTGTGTTVDGSVQDTVAAVDLSGVQQTLSCGTDNVSMRVTFDATDLGAATSPSYDDVLTITVAPN